MTETYGNGILFTELFFQEGKNGDKEEKLENNIYVSKSWMLSTEGWRIRSTEDFHWDRSRNTGIPGIALFNFKKRQFTPQKQCGGSGMFIPDPQTATRERGEKKFFVIPFCRHKFHKIENYFSFEVLKKKIWANFQRIIELFTQKIVTKLSKTWLWDPGSGKNLFQIPDPGSRGQKGTGSRIPDPQHCAKVVQFLS
jgi:hypothetical protein